MKGSMRGREGHVPVQGSHVVTWGGGRPVQWHCAGADTDLCQPSSWPPALSRPHSCHHLSPGNTSSPSSSSVSSITGVVRGDEYCKRYWRLWTIQCHCTAHYLGQHVHHQLCHHGKGVLWVIEWYSLLQQLLSVIYGQNIKHCFVWYNFKHFKTIEIQGLNQVSHDLI